MLTITVLELLAVNTILSVISESAPIKTRFVPGIGHIIPRLHLPRNCLLDAGHCGCYIVAHRLSVILSNAGSFVLAAVVRQSIDTIHLKHFKTVL